MKWAAASAHTVVADEFVKEMQLIIKKGSYSHKKIFSIAKNAVFWTRKPSRT